MRRRADFKSMSLRVLGTERRNKTSMSSGTLRAETMVLVVAVLRERDVARARSSWW